MQGHIIIVEPSSDDEVVRYWTGTQLSENIEDGRVFEDKAAARVDMAPLVSAYTDNDIRLRKAEHTVRIIE